MPFLDDLPSKGQIFEYWKDRLSEFGFFVDWGEPGCWVCGFHYDAKYDVKHSRASWDKVLARWNKIPLQRCHIVPRSLGGSNYPNNLFLMCRECHDTAPNTNIPELFFQWARAQRWTLREQTKIETALGSFGIAGSELDELNQLIRSTQFKKWLSDKFGLHRPQSNYAPRSSRLTPATLIGLAAHYRQTQNDLKKRRGGRLSKVSNKGV